MVKIKSYNWTQDVMDAMEKANDLGKMNKAYGQMCFAKEKNKEAVKELGQDIDDAKQKLAESLRQLRININKYYSIEEVKALKTAFMILGHEF